MYTGLMTGSWPRTGGKAELSANCRPNLGVPVFRFATPANRWMRELPGSLRRSYHDTSSLVPFGSTAIDGDHWSRVPPSLFTRIGAPQEAPPVVDCRRYTLALSPAAWSL